MDYQYSVELIRFKPSGKYYDQVGFATDSSFIFEIADEIRQRAAVGLISDSFDYLITGREYEEGDTFAGVDLPNGHPAFVKVASR